MIFGTGAFTEKTPKALGRENIEQRTRDVQEKCKVLKDKAKERSNRLEDAVEMKLFTHGVKTLNQWVDTTKNALNASEHVRDIQTAEIGDEIRAIQDEVGPLIHMGQKMYGRPPSHKTGEEMKAVLMGCQEKVNNHLVVVNKVVERGKKLISGPSYASEGIATTIANQFFLKVAKVGSWIGDKDQSMKRAAYSKDEDSSVKLLDKVNHVKLDPVVTQVNNSIYSLCHNLNFPF